MKTSNLILCAVFGAMLVSAPLAGIAAEDKSATSSSESAKTDADKNARHQKKAECYKQANAQNLHGKARKSFVHDCMKK